MTEPAGKLVTPVGFDASGNILPLLLGADGSVIVSLPSPSLFLPVPKSSAFFNGSLPAGDSNQDAVTIPANQYWRLSVLAVAYSGTVLNVHLYPYVYNGTDFIYFGSALTITNLAYNVFPTNILCAPAWKIGVTVQNATLNDDLFVKYGTEQVYTA